MEEMVRGCISSANYSIIINGRPRDKIISSRGLRQGDPLSLSILVFDSLVIFWLVVLDWVLYPPILLGIHLSFESEILGIHIDQEDMEWLLTNMVANRDVDLLLILAFRLGGIPNLSLYGRRLWKECNISSVYAFISKMGEIPLSKLLSMPTYYLSLFEVPSKVSKTMDKIIQGFFWERSCGDKVCTMWIRRLSFLNWWVGWVLAIFSSGIRLFWLSRFGFYIDENGLWR